MNIEKKYLLVRAKINDINREDEFKNGLVSIGWSKGVSFKNLTREEFEKIFDYKGKTAITQIINFISLKSEDIILTPSIEEKKLYVYKVKSEYSYIKEKEQSGNPHSVKVELLKIIKYTDLPENLKKVIAASRRPVTNIEKYSKNIDMLYSERLQKKEILYLELKNKSLEILKECLDSKNESVKIQAALGILNYLN